MHRLFVALRPPPPIRQRLLDIAEGVGAARWQDDEQLHLTLRFIGAVERPVAEEVAAALAQVGASAPIVRLAGVGRFGRRAGDALWAGVAPRARLAELHRKVDRACVRAGLEPERRAFLPHVTLARLPRAAAGDPAIELDGGSCRPVERPIYADAPCALRESSRRRRSALRGRGAVAARDYGRDGWGEALMRMVALLALPALALGLAGCGRHEMATGSPLPNGARAVATLRTATGTEAGRATVTEVAGGLRVTLDARGLPPGTHGAHLHTTGLCDAPAFTGAGPHWNPTARRHGAMNPQGPHGGDLPNLVVGSDGRGTLGVTLPGAAMAGLLDADGGAMVVHAGADDLMTDPAGNSGGRIACGVFAPA